MPIFEIKEKLAEFVEPAGSVIEYPLPQETTTITDNIQQKFLEELKTNAMLWGMLFCSHHFRIPSPDFHLKILQETEKYKFVAIASPRESSKSTLIAFNKVAHSICFKKKRFILIVSNTYKKACSSLDSVKKEIRENEKIKAVFKISITKDAEGDSIFRHLDGFEIRVLCKGAEQIGAVRGEKFGAYRPDLIIIDDVEDDEMVKNPERRQALRELYDEALIPAGEKGLVEVIVIGTILHDDSLLARLVSTQHYPEYRKMLYKALRKNKTGEWQSLWKEKWSVGDLQKLEKEKPVVFAKEYQNDPVSGAMQRFHKEDFRYWHIDNKQYVLFDEESRIISKGELSDCKAGIACDLAWSEKKEADDTVILPAFLTPDNEILVDNYICEKGMRPDRFTEHLFTMEQRLRLLTGSTVVVGFEKAMLEKVTNWVLKQEMQDRGIWLYTKELKWETDKITRIETVLQPRYAQHIIFHRRNMGDLEHQLIRFPSGVHDDLIDGLQAACRILEYPKQARTPKEPEDKFMALRQFAIKTKYPTKERFVFGRKNKMVEIPHEICPI